MPTPRDAEQRDVRADGRDETPEERADRNWSEILQKLRVLQTGTQILTGFLLALAFQPAFAQLTPQQRTVYLILVVLAGLSAIIALAPVALHRALFRRRAKPTVVRFGHIALVLALTAVGLLMAGVVAFVFDVVVADAAAWAIVAGLGVVIVGAWIVVPLVIRVRLSESEQK